MFTKSVEYSFSDMSNFSNLPQSEADYVAKADKNLTALAKGHNDNLFFNVNIEHAEIVKVCNYFKDIGNEEENIVWVVEITLNTGAKLSQWFTTDSVIKVSVTEFDQVIFYHVVKG